MYECIWRGIVVCKGRGRELQKKRQRGILLNGLCQIVLVDMWTLKKSNKKALRCSKEHCKYTQRSCAFQSTLWIGWEQLGGLRANIYLGVIRPKFLCTGCNFVVIWFIKLEQSVCLHLSRSKVKFYFISTILSWNWWVYVPWVYFSAFWTCPYSLSITKQHTIINYI